MSGVFAKVESFIDDTLLAVSNTISSQLNNGISTILVSSISLYIAIYGFGRKGANPYL